MGIPSIPVKDLIPMLQIAIGPVILISGVGLLLLSLTNRFGRAVDRSRLLRREMRGTSETEQRRLAGQVAILYQRARLIRLSIILAAISVFLAAVLIIVLFLAALAQIEVGLVISMLFIGCMMSLICSLGAFIWDIHVSLTALKLELSHEDPD